MKSASMSLKYESSGSNSTVLLDDIPQARALNTTLAKL